MKKLFITILLFCSVLTYSQILPGVVASQGTTTDPTAPPACMTDGNTKGWFEDDVDDVLKDGSDYLTQWTDLSGNNNHLINASGTDRPQWTVNGIVFDGSDDYLYNSSFIFAQPITVYIVLEQVSFVTNDPILRLNTVNCLLRQVQTPSRINLYAGTNNIYVNATEDVMELCTMILNGASSSLQINNGVPVTGDPGTNTATVLQIGSSSGVNAEMIVRAVVVRAISDSVPDQASIKVWLNAKYTIY